MATLKIDIIAVGRLKERFWEDASSEYLKRLRPYATVQVIEVDDVDSARAGSIAAALDAEAAAITKRLSYETHSIILDSHGREHSSEEIAALIEEQLSGQSHHLTFIIGGSHGLAERIKALSNKALSFGPVTLPHNLARIVLLEQLYRAFKIIRNEPYHK